MTFEQQAEENFYKYDVARTDLMMEKSLHKATMDTLKYVHDDRELLKDLLLKVCKTLPNNIDIEVYGGQELVEWYKKNSV